MKNKKDDLNINFDKYFTNKERDLIKDLCFKIVTSELDDLDPIIKVNDQARFVYFHFIFLLAKFLADSVYPPCKEKFIESLAFELSKPKFCDDLVEEICMDNATIELAP